MIQEATDIGLVFRALDFAAKKHRDQRRKDTADAPYINHPIAVARLLTEVGGVRDEKVLAAAILHDTLEDTRTTAAELDAEFSPEIRQIVEEVTDDKTLPSAERKRRQIDHAHDLSPRAAAVKIADKIDNVRDIARSPPKGWDIERRLTYCDWASAVVEGCPKVHPKLEAYFATVVEQAREKIAAQGSLPGLS